MKFASASPKGSSFKSLLFPPTSSVHTPVKSPSKRVVGDVAPFSSVPLSTSPGKRSTIPFPQTPRKKHVDTSGIPVTPQTPSTKIQTPSTKIPADTNDAGPPPETPSKQTGANAETAPTTPSTSRRQALYERIRQRSLTASPTKNTQFSGASGSNLTRDQLLKLSQDEMRRRCLLGRLGGVAESVWMFVFSFLYSLYLDLTVSY